MFYHKPVNKFNVQSRAIFTCAQGALYKVLTLQWVKRAS